MSKITKDYIASTPNVLAAEVGEMLIAKSWTVTCAESCTGGGLAQAFTAISGSSKWFERSWVTYSNAAKKEMLDVRQDTLKEHGAVSAQTVKEMAEGAAKKAHAELAIAISGIAGPSGGSKEKPVGLVWFGLFHKHELRAQSIIFEGGRTEVRNAAVNHALQLLYESLIV